MTELGRPANVRRLIQPGAVSCESETVMFMSMVNGSVAPDMVCDSVIPVRKQKSMPGRRQAHARLGGIGAGQIRCEPPAW